MPPLLDFCLLFEFLANRFIVTWCGYMQEVWAMNEQLLQRQQEPQQWPREQSVQQELQSAPVKLAAQQEPQQANDTQRSAEILKHQCREGLV